jgi:hypothetical protein
MEGKHDSAGLFRFGGVLRSSAIGRSLGGDQTITRIELESAVILARPE